VKSVYNVPEIELLSFDIEDIITVSVPITTNPPSTTSGGIGIGGTGDGEIDFSDIP
jgi:hypothetical protein